MYETDVKIYSITDFDKTLKSKNDQHLGLIVIFAGQYTFLQPKVWRKIEKLLDGGEGWMGGGGWGLDGRRGVGVGWEARGGGLEEEWKRSKNNGLEIHDKMRQW